MDRERRGDIVRLLQTLGETWLREPDGSLLQRLAALPVFADIVLGVDSAELAVAYADTFLQLVPPYASMFLSDEGMLNAEPAEDALRMYARSGFELRPEWRAGAADHLGVELLFLAALIEAGGPSEVDFLNEYVLTWAPICCLAVERADNHPLYRALARLTLDVLLALEDELTP